MRYLHILLTFLFVGLTSYVSAEPMKFVYYENYPPRSYKEDGIMKGVLVDVMNEIVAKRMNINIEHKGYPWKRAQTLVKNGEADAFVTVPTKVRREYTIVSKEPVVTFETFVATMKNNPKAEQLRKVKSIEELKDFTLIDYLGNGWAKSVLRNHEVIWLPDEKDIYRFLKSGKADAVIVSRKSLHTIRKLDYSKDILVFDNPLTSVKFHLCIAKSSKYTKIMNDFDIILKKVKKEGIIDSILEVYY